MSFSPPEQRAPLTLREIQRLMATVVLNPLAPDNTIARSLEDGQSTKTIADQIMKPNDRLSSVERIEIYNRQYWFRLLDCLYDDFPGLRTILGEKAFRDLCVAYLQRHPSDSYSLRDLPRHLVPFLIAEPKWLGRRATAGLDMARFEWAQIVAFDGPALPTITFADLQGVSPEKMSLSLQPYLSLLALSYPFDEFVVALKRREKERSEAATLEASERPDHTQAPLPKRERIHVIVHRYQNSLYYKRVERSAFHLLEALRDGASLAHACEVATRYVPSNPRPPRDISSTFQQWFLEWSALGWFAAKADEPQPAR